MSHNTLQEREGGREGIIDENIQSGSYLHNAPHNWQIELSNARLMMSEANRDQFDIEAADHLEYLYCNPDAESDLQRSIMHRIQMYQSRNMTKVPPMLLQRVGESAKDHEDRELAAGGFVRVDTLSCPPDAFLAVDTDMEPQTTEENQQELF